MFRSAFFLIATLASLALACGPGVQENPAGGGSDGGSSGGADGGSNSTGNDGFPCSSSKPCPSGQFCWNGICVLGCNTNAECAKDQYCDTDRKQCANKTVPTCPETACAETQECLKGFCTAKEQPSTQCQVTFDANDGCAANAFCFEESENVNQCHTFPACPEDGNCPAGVSGALCNDKLFAGKARVCLPGVCKTAANCPAQWKCVKPNPSDVIGQCSNGSPGMSCTTPGDCLSGNCFSAGPGFPGVCM